MTTKLLPGNYKNLAFHFRGITKTLHNDASNHDVLHVYGRWLDINIRTNEPLKLIRLYQKAQKELSGYTLSGRTMTLDLFRGAALCAGFVVERVNRQSHWYIRRKQRGSNYSTDLGLITYGEPIDEYRQKWGDRTASEQVHELLDECIDNSIWQDETPYYEIIKRETGLTPRNISTIINAGVKYKRRPKWDKVNKKYIKQIRKLPQYVRRSAQVDVTGESTPGIHVFPSD